MDIRSADALRFHAACRRAPSPACRARKVMFTALLGRLFAGTGARAKQANPLPEDFTEMSLGALMDIEIIPVSKRPQKKSGAAATVFVIQQEDLRCWGATTIPDALRRVPGIQGARIDANTWAITALGFNGRLANKLLVLIDGRSVYTPLFAGVCWEPSTVMPEDVERIEVIRGPGGTLWGANAVNGVINIITRSAADTPGSLVTAGTDNEKKGFINLRHGAVTADGRHYRVYGMFRAVDTGAPTDIGHPRTAAHGDSEFAQAGFRMDWNPLPGLALSLVGQNLLDDRHPEFNPDFIFSVPTQVERSIYGSVNWEF